MNLEEINHRKKALRNVIKEKKKTFSHENAILDSDIIFSRVESLPQFKAANTILAYWSLSDEVITHSFIMKWVGTKKMVLPIVVGDSLELRAFNGLESLVKSDSFGIHEPKVEELINPKEIDLAIIPGIAFDNKGNRLGRGKGFYDRFLKQTNAFKVGVGYDFQIVDELPVSSLDVPMDIVLFT